ncbi:MAG: DUF5060 domain-containing protein [Phycisphaeraceae bacterium]
MTRTRPSTRPARPFCFILPAILFASLAPSHAHADATLSGELKQWHRVSLTFTGPDTSEDAATNPFRDYRLSVSFTNDAAKLSIEVPGFYAADGNAGETGADKGNKWRVHFAPPAEGRWDYVVSFRTGKDIAVDSERLAGEAVSFNGEKGALTIGKSDKTGPDFRGKGALRYVGKHYLQFAGSKEFFIKGGTDSPENLLGYADFDGTYRHPKANHSKGPNTTDDLHRYEPHLRDWKQGDPTWQRGKGKGLIGGLNYLSSQGVNSIYFLTMNVEGDGRDAWPWTKHDRRDRFDCSKLDQWELVFSHATARGIQLHIITQEQENDQLLDKGDLGLERKLYYRELIARFAHHPAVVWNLGEENTNTHDQRKAFCDFLHGLDAYDHPVVCHTFPGKYDEVYEPLLGHKTFEGPSLQTNATHEQVKRWVNRSAQAGRPWVVHLDEIGPADTGVKPDKDDPDHFEVRSKHLWGALMAGSAGVEWYFGYKYAHNDLNLEDFRSRENLWKQTRIAREFFEKHVPFTNMRHADELISAKDGYCFAQPGDAYVIYLPKGGTTDLNLGKMDFKFNVLWYNPREGGNLVAGTVREIKGPGMVSIGKPPADADKDWVTLIGHGESPQRVSLIVHNGHGSGKYPGGAAVPIHAYAGKPHEYFDGWHEQGDRILSLVPNDNRKSFSSDDANAVVIVEGRTLLAASMAVAAHYKVSTSSTLPVVPIRGEGTGKVVSFTLINADTGKPIEGFDPLADNAVIKLGKLPTRNLSIRANVEGDVKSVRFGLNDKENFRTEGAAPFSLTGDTQGKYNAWTPGKGKHLLTGTGGSGSLKIEFTVEE